jgi:hypothetical protein
MWLAYAFALSLLLTNQHAYIVLRSLHIFSIVGGAFCVWLLYQDKKIRLGNIFTSWLFLILFLAPVYYTQYLLASLGYDDVVKHAYKVGVFQFPRLHGFSFEPLFLANWLLPPLFYALHRSRERLFIYLATIVSSLLFLTLARSAIHGLLVGCALYIIYSGINRHGILKIARPLLFGLLISFYFIGLSSSINYSSPSEGIGRYLDHLTLGVFNLEDANNVSYRDVEVTQDDGTIVTESYIDGSQLDTKGVVEGSTIGRLQAIKEGLTLFRDNPVTGVGLLRSGEEANKTKPEVFKGTKFVTNSLPVDILAETGLIGVSLLAAFLVSARRLLFRPRNLVFVILVALAVQSLFFSSLVMLPFWIMIALSLARNDKELGLGKNSNRRT